MHTNTRNASSNSTALLREAQSCSSFILHHSLAGAVIALPLESVNTRHFAMTGRRKRSRANESIFRESIRKTLISDSVPREGGPTRVTVPRPRTREGVTGSVGGMASISLSDPAPQPSTANELRSFLSSLWEDESGSEGDAPARKSATKKGTNESSNKSRRRRGEDSEDYEDAPAEAAAVAAEYEAAEAELRARPQAPMKPFAEMTHAEKRGLIAEELSRDVDDILAEEARELGEEEEDEIMEAPPRIDIPRVRAQGQPPFPTVDLSAPAPRQTVLYGDFPFPLELPEQPYALRVCVLGTPNAGKSVLVNNLTRAKVSAVSPKANTTRRQTLGILTEGNTQILLYDTPGINEIHTAKQYQRELATEAWDAVADADVALVVIDAAKRIGGPELFLLSKVKETLRENPNLRAVLVLNKVDVVEPKTRLLDLTERLSVLVDFTDCFMISAASGDGVADLEVGQFMKFTHSPHLTLVCIVIAILRLVLILVRVVPITLFHHSLSLSLSFSPSFLPLQNYLFMNSVPREWEFDSTDRTDRTELEQASEIVREAIYQRLNKELPYQVRQETVSWVVLRNGSLRLDQRLLVLRQQHREILSGAALKAITARAQQDLEATFKRKVHLYLRVQVRDQLPADDDMM